MKKQKLTAVFSDGDEKTRTTAATFDGSQKYLAAWRARKEGARRDVYGFCGTLALAQKTADSWHRHGWQVTVTDNVSPDLTKAYESAAKREGWTRNVARMTGTVTYQKGGGGDFHMFEGWQDLCESEGIALD